MKIHILFLVSPITQLACTMLITLYQRITNHKQIDYKYLLERFGIVWKEILQWLAIEGILQFSLDLHRHIHHVVQPLDSCLSKVLLTHTNESYYLHVYEQIWWANSRWIKAKMTRAFIKDVCLSISTLFRHELGIKLAYCLSETSLKMHELLSYIELPPFFPLLLSTVCSQM